jgi:hypothetical protein
LQANDDRKKVATAITQRWVIRDDNIGGPKTGSKKRESKRKKAVSWRKTA